MKKRDKPTKNSVRYFKYAVLGSFTAFFLYVIYGQAALMLKRSDYFKVRQILYDQGSEFIKISRLAGLKNKNIFEVDLNAEQKYLQRQYPEISQLQIYRRFPDQLVVLARKRVAFAKANIKNRNVILDEEGVVLTPIAETPDLPTIYGKGLGKADVSPGTAVRGADLRCALKVIRNFKENRRLDSYQISKINVDNLSQVYFYILKTEKTSVGVSVLAPLKVPKTAALSKNAVNEELKIIIDRDDIPHKMKILELILSQAKPEFGDVQYVDLRFKEPILGKKDQQK